MIGITGKYYFDGIFGSILMYGGFLLIIFSSLQWLRVTKLRIQGKLFKANEPEDFIKAKEAYENITSKEWNDVGRIYFFHSFKESLLSNGHISDEDANIEATKNVHDMYPRYSKRQDNEGID